jgi:inorganic pyrophosphatase/exopolyphosphatase
MKTIFNKKTQIKKDQVKRILKDSFYKYSLVGCLGGMNTILMMDKDSKVIMIYEMQGNEEFLYFWDDIQESIKNELIADSFFSLSERLKQYQNIFFYGDAVLLSGNITKLALDQQTSKIRKRKIYVNSSLSDKKLEMLDELFITARFSKVKETDKLIGFYWN